ncbi:MAG: class I SAM-dependent methyltransferase [Verrucomicrobiota bacterium]|nr:class I SAM-dependent methyltransferase [Verrucomicrobiota bacterium]
MTTTRCRFCNTPLQHTFVDLGMSPISNAYLKPDQGQEMERFYPLHVRVCHNCFLVQLPEFQSPQEIFSDYAYFSSYSESWLQHCQAYVAQMLVDYPLHSGSLVMELASNDGYLLQFFQKAGIPVLGVEPAANVAEVARSKGIPTEVRFFGVETARQLPQADLIIGNNVLAHVPDINDFVGGIALALAPAGVITMEFPHLLRLIQNNQFDTIYHEHFSYLSLTAVEAVFAHHKLALFHVDEIPTHGGSLRIYAQHAESPTRPTTQALLDLRKTELAAGFDQIEAYGSFQKRVHQTKRDLLKFLIAAKEAGQSIVGYGAPAKGNTLLNYCGIREDFLDYTVDRSPHKQGHLLPGTHIPIHAPEKIFETRPDYVLILPWNIREEIVSKMSRIREWGGKFVVPIPTVEIIP